MKRALRILLGGAAIAALGCGGGEGEPADEAAEEPATRARELARELVVVDTHIDVPYRLRDTMADISEATEDGDFDYPRAVAGGLDVAFMSIYVPARYQEEGDPGAVAEELIAMVEGFAADDPDKFALAGSVAEARAAKAAGLVALPMGMENGAPIRELADVERFFDRGIRYVTLTHSEDNQLCDSSYVDPGERTWKGLSPFGREVVAEMNRVGVMIDVSHVSDDAFWQVMEISRAPAIASHSSCRAFTPGWERNIADDMIVRLAEGGGVVMINFGSAFLRQDAQQQSEAFWEAYQEFLETSGAARASEEAQQFRRDYFADEPQIFADLADVVAHIDHVVELVGIDHVGLGSDFDGVGDSLPTGLKSVADYPNLIGALLEAGHSEEEVAKIAGENLLRVWAEVEGVAAEMQAEGG